MENFININNIILDMKTEDKNLIINKMVETISEEKFIDKEKFIADIIKREETENTVVGFKVAIPHGKSEYIKFPQIVFTKLKDEIFWGDPEEKVKYIFLLGVPASSAGKHIEILMKLSKKILDEKFREELENTNNKEKLLKIILE